MLARRCVKGLGKADASVEAAIKRKGGYTAWSLGYVKDDEEEEENYRAESRLLYSFCDGSCL